MNLESLLGEVKFRQAKNKDNTLSLVYKNIEEFEYFKNKPWAKILKRI